MIISDVHKFTFIHIPKCGGTTIRSHLQKYDDLRSEFWGRLDMHPQLGPLDKSHIPLFVLKEYFPDQYDALQNYWSFAVLRDPYARFASSVSQRLRMSSAHSFDELSIQELRGIIDQDIQFLSKRPKTQHLLPSEYIHFQKQVDYVFESGECQMSKLYTLEHLQMLMDDLLHQFGINVSDNENRNPSSLRQANQSTVYRSSFIHNAYKSIKPIRWVLSKIVPLSTKLKLHSMLLVPRDKRFREIFDTTEVRSFIAYYYAEDIALYNQVKMGGSMCFDKVVEIDQHLV